MCCVSMWVDVYTDDAADGSENYGKYSHTKQYFPSYRPHLGILLCCVCVCMWFAVECMYIHVYMYV